MKNLIYITIISMLAFSSCTVEVKIDGCTDPCGTNYNALADNDDNSCTYFAGCTDPMAINYDECAGPDDGSCLYIIGCTDPAAINYNPQAILDDGSCVYGISGCTDPAAINYNTLATTEPPNSCNYTCDVVYYLDYTAATYMDLAGIDYYQFYDYNGSNIGYIMSDYYWNSPPNCNPQPDGSTLIASLYWTGNYNSNTANFAWAAYPNNGPIADYDGSFIVTPNDCVRVELSFKKIQEYKASK